MKQEDIEKITKYVLRFVPARSYRRFIWRTVKLVGKWVAVLAVLSAVLSFALDGTEFIRKKIPQATAIVSKWVLLSEAFRPRLAKHVLENDLAYSNFCIISNQLLDLDNDGDSTDLLIEFNFPDPKSGCTDRQSAYPAVWVVLKEVAWRDIWPRYTLLRAISLEKAGLPMTFQQLGPFLLGGTYGTDFPGYQIFGYAGGVLHSFGYFSPVGSLMENPQAIPKAQIGNRLFLHTEQGMKSFEITPLGQFVTRSMSAHEIVEQNNTAFVIEDADKLPQDIRARMKNPKTTGSPLQATRYTLVETPDAPCTDVVFVNGVQATFKPEKIEMGTGDWQQCTSELKVSSVTAIISNVPCNYEGFRRAEQFPWGHIYDPNQSTHTIGCPAEGDKGYNYVFRVVID